MVGSMVQSFPRWTFSRHFLPKPCRATASSWGAVRVRCIAQGQHDTPLGGAGD